MNTHSRASIAQLARDVGGQRTSVLRAVQRLDDEGYISKNGRTIRCRLPEIYRSDFVTPRDALFTKLDTPDRHMVRRSVGETVTSGDASENETVTSGDATVTSCDANRHMVRHPTKANKSQKGKPTKASPAPAPTASKKKSTRPTHPAVGIYTRKTELTPNKDQRRLIINAVGTSGRELKAWERALVYWNQNGWRKTSVAKMIDVYEKVRDTGKLPQRPGETKPEPAKPRARTFEA